MHNFASLFGFRLEIRLEIFESVKHDANEFMSEIRFTVSDCVLSEIVTRSYVARLDIWIFVFLHN